MDNVKNILENVKNGNISVDEALLKLKIEPFEDLAFAKIDHHKQRRGFFQKRNKSTKSVQKWERSI